jgi:hypothetical protein
MPFPITIQWICHTKQIIQTMLHVTLLPNRSQFALDFIYSSVAFESFFFPSSTMSKKTCNANSSSFASQPFSTLQLT